MSAFDVEAFMSSATTEANSTRSEPVPEGEYTAIAHISDDPQNPAVRTTMSGKVVLDVHWSIDDAGVKEVTGRDDPQVRQSIFLDIDANGRLDVSKGKNLQLGRLREALGLNTPGIPFKFADISGKVARVLVKHRLDAEGTTWADVKGVTKA